MHSSRNRVESTWSRVTYTARCELQSCALGRSAGVAGCPLRRELLEDDGGDGRVIRRALLTAAIERAVLGLAAALAAAALAAAGASM